MKQSSDLPLINERVTLSADWQVAHDSSSQQCASRLASFPLLNSLDATLITLNDFENFS